MNTFLLVSGAAVLVFALIICQLKVFREKHPNAEMLARLYQMITSNE
jgi:hypothetical protein